VVSILIPLMSAFVGAGAAWYSTRRALKVEQKKINFEGTLKVAEFRQTWINDLRDAMAEFQSYGVVPDQNPSQERKFYELGTKIELLMNPSDPDYGALSATLYNFLITADGNTIEKYSNNSLFVDLCQRILKREWERLKTDIENATGSDV
ncbi:MAG: hypothetical protein KDI19_15510, partial [Pseudomonadales bacterium]|nr:hypothetical protein [Pseudomonadales bacterium]